MPRPEYKDRQFNLIFPTESDLDQWQEEAKKNGISLCKYIFEMAEKGRREDTSPRLDLIRETDQSREELTKLRRDLKDKSAAIEKLETELYHLRHQSFLQPTPNGLEHYGEDLIKLLKEGRTWRGSELLKELGVDPMNTQALAIISRQLQNLQDLEMVQEGPKGWKWIG